MKFFTNSLLFLFICALAPLPALAQEAGGIRPSLQPVDRSYRANPYYDYEVRQAMLYMRDDYRFNKLRSLYVDTSQYDPIGEDTVNAMQKLAYIVQSDGDYDKRAQAIESYRNLVMMHMGNIRVVAQALAFAKLDSTFGSPRFFSWLRKGLVRDLISVGDGKSINSAYHIITLSEETVLIGQLGLRVINTVSADQGTLFYNMHEVENIKTGQRSTLFVNTTRPLVFLRMKKAQQDSTSDFKILRQ
ncbi:MAG: hypothetical protein GW778_09100 [Alphaproteobacteria bacterium]|nr:hypothetical protein [Alphaproteobacteria bacterium]